MKYILPLFLFLLLAGCQSGSGIHVGNAMTYRSPQGFEFQYAKQLSVTADLAGSRIRVDNRNLVQPGETISVVEIQMTGSQLGEGESLHTFARGQNRYRTFQQGSASNSPRVFSIQEGSGGVSGIYFFQIRNRQIVNGTLEANPSGRGVELLRPVLDSFRANRS